MPIQRAAGTIETFTVGGSTVETHDASAITQVNTTYLNENKLVATFADGTPATNSFGSFPRARNFILTVDLVTGAWRTSAGTSGALSGGQLTALKNNQTNLKNGLENVANAIGLLPGSIVAWT